MLRLSLRNLLAHKGRFLLTTTAVVLGVGFVVGSFILADTLRDSIGELFTDISTGVDVTVRAKSTGESNVVQGGSNAPVSRDLVDVVNDVDGVNVAEGTLTRPGVQLIDLNGDPVTSTGAPFLGVTWGENDELYPVTLDSGSKPQGPDEVAIDRGQAEDFDFEVGDRTTVQLIEGSREVEIVGIFTFGEANNLLGARLTAFDAAVADEVFAAGGQVDTIEVNADDGVSPSELADRISAILPDGVEAVTQDQVIADNVEATDQFVSIFQIILLVFAGISMFVSAFIINNTFAIILGQRTRELSLIRAVGASVSQVRRSVVLEALFVGSLASIVGAGVGIGIAQLLGAVLNAGGFGLPQSGLVFLPRTAIAALVVGIGVTVMASLIPARRVGSVSIIEGMADGAPASERSSRRLPIGTILAGLGVVGVVLGLFVVSDTANRFILLGVGAALGFIGISWLSPLFAAPVTGFLGRPFARVFASPGRLARENTVRNPDRTARTASALMIGLAVVSMVFVVGTSIKETFAAAIDNAVAADWVFSGPGQANPFSPAVAAAVSDLPEIDAVTGVRFDRFVVADQGEDLLAVDATDAGRLVDIGVQRGAVEDLVGESIALHADSATELGVDVGDPLTVTFTGSEPRALEVVAVYDDATFAGNFLVDMATFEAAYPTNQLDFAVFAGTADGVAPDEARDAIESVLEAFPQVVLEDRTEYRQTQEDSFAQILLIVNVLLGLALVIALMGISNTLALSVLERTREIGLLRAVGMQRRQTRTMVLVESTIVAIFGALLGVAVGVALGLAAAAALPDSVVMETSVPVGTLVTVVVIAGLAGVLAGLSPARRAARLDVLEAIAAS